MLLKLVALLLLLAKCGAVPLLVSWKTSIKMFESSNTSNMQSILPSTHLAVSLDYHYNRNEIYFSDGMGQIKRAWLRPQNASVEPVVIAEVKLSDGLAVDWINDNIYWTDTVRHTVEMASLDGLHRRVLFNSTHGVEKPRAIVLDPFEGLLFWTDWGTSEKVESSGLDGKDRATILSEGLFWPNGLALDMGSKVVYVLEGFRATLISCQYDGGNKQILLRSDQYLRQAFGMTYFSGTLYWDSWKDKAVFSMNLASQDVETVYQKTREGGLLENMMGIKAVHPSLQRQLTKPNPCKTKGCSHYCVNGRSFTASCMCNYGYTLQPDGKTCLEDGYLMVSWRRTIRRYTLQGKEEEQMFDYGKACIAIAYHYKKKLVFWSDIEEHRIYRAPLDQLNNKTLVASTETCDGLAVDWVHDVIYWTDTMQNTLEAAELDGAKHRVIFSEDLDQPRDIAIDPQSGYMFWTDWGANPKIERAVLDGSERTTIVNEDLVWPNGITIDFEQSRIYWVDGKLATISSTLYDGSDRRQILEHASARPQPFGISLFQDKIYWTDWTLQALAVGDKLRVDHSEARVIANSSLIVLRPNGVKVVHSTLQKDQDNSCASMKCSDLCLGTKNPRQGHCTGVTQTHDRLGYEDVTLEKEVTNDTIRLSLNSLHDTTIPLAVVSVQCVGRNGCSNDKRCSKDSEEKYHIFRNTSEFNISGLLPASHYNVKFESKELNDHFQLVTSETYPPERVNITSVEVIGRSVLFKWNPIDTCVPGFRGYVFSIVKKPGRTYLRGGSTNDTQILVENLETGKNYTLELYTYSRLLPAARVEFSQVEEPTPECRQGEYLCNGAKDCPDGSDETLHNCAGIDNVVVYSKNSSSVSFRVNVTEGTKRNLVKFSVNGSGTVDMENPAVLCTAWPESYCFTLGSLDTNNLYNFSIAATLNDSRSGAPFMVSATTKEEESGPPEDLLVIGYTATSVELQWRRPDQSNGHIRSFIVSITELETFDKDKCCLEFPILESRVTTEDPTYRIEAGSLTPAATYNIVVSVKNLYIGGSRSIQVTTPPPPIRILREPSLVLPTDVHVVWKQQPTVELDEPQYHSLVQFYLLLASPGKDTSRPWVPSRLASEPYYSLLETQLGPNYILLAKFTKEEIESPPTYKIQSLQRSLSSATDMTLAWVQVAKYKEVYSFDYMMSETIKTFE